jgi:hypothetical protein
MVAVLFGKEETDDQMALQTSFGRLHATEYLTDVLVILFSAGKSVYHLLKHCKTPHFA